MCGITGIINFDNNPISPPILKRMTDAIYHLDIVVPVVQWLKYSPMSLVTMNTINIVINMSLVTNFKTHNSTLFIH